MFRRGIKRYLRKLSGVIHVGAHAGQERDLYAKYGLRVLWIEANPEIFARLVADHGFREYGRRKHLEHVDGGGLYDIVYRRKG